MSDANERRALLLHLGDVLEAMACVSKCCQHHNTIGDALRQEESLVSFSILADIDSEMTPHEFIKKAANAFFLWPKELLGGELNRKLLAHLVQHDLFAGDQVGWDRYASAVRKNVPWFGEGLESVPEPDAEPSKATWPPTPL
jgi:hypothetical protein